MADLTLSDIDALQQELTVRVVGFQSALGAFNRDQSAETKQSYENARQAMEAARGDLGVAQLLVADRMRREMLELP